MYKRQVLQQVQGLNLRIARAVPVQLPDELLVQLKKHFIEMLLVGEPDSGKTTLLRQICLLYTSLAAELQARGVKLVSGGTDNHLMLIDLRDEECTGKELEARLDSVHITANRCV